jgi:hypothetical protein
MGRLGEWAPGTLEERVDRLESIAAIGQLASRYALALDSRNMDDMVALFVENVRVGRDKAGRAALKEWYTEVMRAFGVSVHFVGNHIIDFDDADHASGIVYCHDELQSTSAGTWDMGKLQYWDTYVRVDGEWCFLRRRFYRWYLADALERPSPGAGMGSDRDSLTTNLLPDAYPTWAAFWDTAGPS